jgi:carbon storage regulator
MLVLSRRVGERILIGNDIELAVTAISGRRVRVGIVAPPELPIIRSELASFAAAKCKSHENKNHRCEATPVERSMAANAQAG